MLKYLTAAFLSVSLLLTIYSCNKNNNSTDEVIDIDSGKFLALVDSTQWHPLFHNAIYYSQWNQLWITAYNDQGAPRAAGPIARLYGGITLDSINPLKKYLLLPNGDDAFNYSEKGKFYSNLNIAGAGGSFTLTKFDTVKKTISGILEFTAIEQTTTKKIKVATTTFEDIPFKTDARRYPGSNTSFTLQGVNTINWQSKNISGAINCATIPNPNAPTAVIDEIMDINISSILRGYPMVNLYIKMPVTKSAGKYQVYPNVAPYIYCGNKHVTSTYTDGKYNRSYMAVSGELNVLSIDSLNRKLEATFNIQYQDTVTKETVTVSNGKISLKSWRRIGD